MKDIIEYLKNNHKTISVMESCTGGMLINEITNIPGASDVFQYGAVTYSNSFKIKMGVNKKDIDKYSVYSGEISSMMAKAIVDYTTSDYGIGITGKLNRPDNNNLYGDNNKVYYTIYDYHDNKCYTYSLIVQDSDRIINKEMVINDIIDKFKEIVK